MNQLTNLITSDAIDELKSSSKLLQHSDSRKKWSRICLHDSPDELLHLMIIAIAPLGQIPFHYSTRTRPIHYLSLNDQIEISIMDTIDSNEITTYILADNLFSVSTNAKYARSMRNFTQETCCFLEVTMGPHISSETIYL